MGQAVVKKLKNNPWLLRGKMEHKMDTPGEGGEAGVGASSVAARVNCTACTSETNADVPYMYLYIPLPKRMIEGFD